MAMIIHRGRRYPVEMITSEVFKRSQELFGHIEFTIPDRFSRKTVKNYVGVPEYPSIEDVLLADFLEDHTYLNKLLYLGCQVPYYYGRLSMDIEIAIFEYYVNHTDVGSLHKLLKFKHIEMLSHGVSLETIRLAGPTENIRWIDQWNPGFGYYGEILDTLIETTNVPGLMVFFKPTFTITVSGDIIDSIISSVPSRHHTWLYRYIERNHLDIEAIVSLCNEVGYTDLRDLICEDFPELEDL